MAQRVGYNCSNPNCRRPTVGAHTDAKKSTLIGVAAHITAAAQGGPRYNSQLSTPERREIENGIWLCESCARLIDKDEARFPVELLNEWKVNAESIAFEALLKHVHEVTPAIQSIPFLELDLIWTYSSKGPIVSKGQRGLSPRNREVFGGGAIPIGEGIYYNQLKWNYELRIYNNSDFAAKNVMIIEDSDYPSFSFIENLPRINNLGALDNMKLSAVYSEEVESTGAEALELIKPNIPPGIEGKKLMLVYKDLSNRIHRTEVILTSNGIENGKV
ncbi:MAG: hypothetical protein AAFO07_01745 [Bacteroidota bacterium]